MHYFFLSQSILHSLLLVNSKLCFDHSFSSYLLENFVIGSTGDQRRDACSIARYRCVGARILSTGTIPSFSFECYTTRNKEFRHARDYTGK